MIITVVMVTAMVLMVSSSEDDAAHMYGDDGNDHYDYDS
jgi:hypothetical protein